MATLKSQDEFIKTALRLPRELHKRIQYAAEAGGRSMNAEIISRLEESTKSPLKELSENLQPVADAVLQALLERVDTVIVQSFGDTEQAKEIIANGLKRLPKPEVNFKVNVHRTSKTKPPEGG